MTTTKGTIIGLILAVVCASQASATTIRVTASSPTGEGPMYTVDIDTTTGIYTENDDGTSTWIGSLSNDVFDLGWNFDYDPDPGVSGNLSVTNNTNSAQLFSTTTGVLSSVLAPSGSAMNGASTISVADSDFSGTPATISSPPGGAVYSGIVNGVVQRNLFPDTPPASYSLTDLGGGVKVDFDTFSGESTSTGLGIGDLLSLKHEFTLTAGDTATANSTFFVVPEPSGLALLVLGLISVTITRQRRR